MNAPETASRFARPSWRRVLIVGFLLAAALVAAAHGARSHVRGVDPSLEPLTLDEARQHFDSITGSHQSVALVLGGGGLRGFAHIGVLRALEEHGIRPDIVVGTSAGAVVGAAYASGETVDQLEADAMDIDVPGLIDLTLDEGGLMRGDEIAQWVDHAAHGKRIEAFPIRFGAVATDLANGDAVLLASGAPGDAVRASSAVPGAMVPVAYRKGYLIDGGVSSLVPVRFARAMGARTVIAVDIYCGGNDAMTLSAPAVIRRSMHLQTCLLAKPELNESDIVIEVDVPMPKMTGRSSRQEAMKAGYKAAKAVLDVHDKDL
jgi:NTE family protein